MMIKLINYPIVHDWTSMQPIIFEGSGANQKKGTFQVISSVDVTRDVSFSHSKAKAEIKDIFQCSPLLNISMNKHVNAPVKAI